MPKKQIPRFHSDTEEMDWWDSRLPISYISSEMRRPSFNAGRSEAGTSEIFDLR